MKQVQGSRFKVQGWLLLVCLALTACGTVAQAAEVPQVVPEPTQTEYRPMVITDAMRSAMDASLQPEAHECRASPLGIFWHEAERQYAITCKLSYAVGQYGVVYFDEYGGLRNTKIIYSYDYSEVAGGLMWLGFRQ